MSSFNPLEFEPVHAPGPALAAASDLLRATHLLDFEHPGIRHLVESRGWLNLAPFERIGAAYDFVRNEIEFGYNRQDELPASEVLADGYGQCNTKTTLLMALLRACGLTCRLHGFTIQKALQQGAMTGWAMPWPHSGSFTAG